MDRGGLCPHCYGYVADLLPAPTPQEKAAAEKLRKQIEDFMRDLDAARRAKEWQPMQLGEQR